ncbi:MAG: hypothetical protein JWM68_4296, partial [Verrucomicrobiales bacterium]|nr:hypothetical protein [Verrucomicrobiales bacterium]
MDPLLNVTRSTERAAFSAGI